MYRILATEVSEETLNTDVEYTFSDGSIETVRIPHFMPKDMDEVVTNIENREFSEQMKRDAQKQNELIAQELQEIIE